MDTLIKKLNEFGKNAKDLSDETKLQKLFEKLAPAFLYGGYIKVRNEYKVYIRTVEFYFHSEKADGIHDPIVYHRNGRGLKDVPYFPIMSLNAHNSGFDITFENKDEKYRASALIRSYEVKSNDEKFYLKWDTEKELFEEKEEYAFNNQSTYLYTLLNGFSLENGNCIKWVDFPRTEYEPIKKTRQNVFQSESEKKYIPQKGKRCNRLWSFTRKEHV
jgi:hypothetical protein